MSGFEGGPPFPPPPPPPPPPIRPVQPGVDGLAVAGLVCAVLGVLTLVTAPIGFALGLGALSRTRRSGQQGRGLALAAVWIGAVITVAYVVFAVGITIALHHHPSCSYVAENNPGGESFQECVNNGTYR